MKITKKKPKQGDIYYYIEVLPSPVKTYFNNTYLSW